MAKDKYDNIWENKNKSKTYGREENQFYNIWIVFLRPSEVILQGFVVDSLVGVNDNHYHGKET